MELSFEDNARAAVTEFPPLDLSESLAIVPVRSMHYGSVAVAGSAGVAFGGHLAAQALMAAAQTLDAPRAAHSVRSVFLAAATPGQPINYHVAWLKRGRAFSVLQVDTRQDGAHCLSTVVSFHDAEHSPEHQMSAPAVVAPDDSPTSRFIPAGTNPDVRRCFDIREADVASSDLPGKHPQQIYWVRSKAALGGSPGDHSAALYWFADLSMPWTTDLLYSTADGERIGASLDHAMWFHRPFRADDWLLFVQESVVYFGARALTRGTFFTRDGKLVASAAQETLLRRILPSPSTSDS